MTTQEFVSPRDALDIVFAHRNRAYGAYQLRRAYPVYLSKAFGIGLLLIGFGLVLPHILSAVSGALPDPPPFNTEIVLSQPPDIDPSAPPPPPPPPPTPPPPVRATFRFVPPAVVPDEKVREEQPPAQEVLAEIEAEIGNKNRESEGDAPPSLNDIPEFIPGVETAAKDPSEEEYTMVTVQKLPMFPGGERELLKFLAENIQYPPIARENNIQGTVALSFVIGKDGSVKDVSVLKDIGGGCGKEAIRVVQSMPRWSPGEASGHPVKVRFTLPVKFKLQ